MSIICIQDIAHVRFAAPDLSIMRDFLIDFGLEPFEVDSRLYGRGSDGRPFLHATETGSARFVALGLQAASREDLERLAQADKTRVEASDMPGGGYIVRLTDPDGYLVEVVAEQTNTAPRALPPKPPHNAVDRRQRFGDLIRLNAGPAHVYRLGHCVLGVSDFRASEAWYKARFGFLTSDEIEAAPNLAIGAFMRCDRGDIPSDHHTVFLAQMPGKPAFMHAAFEVQDLDDLMMGHHHLKAKSRKSVWGVGRHIMGSQIFDYWLDPWGHELEHWTDGDLLTASVPPQKKTFQDLLAAQWGPSHPMVTGKLAPNASVLAGFITFITRLKGFFKRRTTEATP